MNIVVNEKQKSAIDWTKSQLLVSSNSSVLVMVAVDHEDGIKLKSPSKDCFTAIVIDPGKSDLLTGSIHNDFSKSLFERFDGSLTLS